MNVTGENPEGEDDKNLGVCNKSAIFDHAPLAAPEDDSDDLAEYAQVNLGASDFSFPHDTAPGKLQLGTSTKLRHRRDNKGQSKLISSLIDVCEFNVFVFMQNTQTQIVNRARQSARMSVATTATTR